MQIKILGCSGAKSVGKSPTSFLIDNKILIDCGSVVSKLDSDFIVKNIECLLLTHSHFDHIMELPFLLELILQEGKNPFSVFASRDSIDSLYSNIFNFECWPDLFQIAGKQGKELNLIEYSDLKKISLNEYSVMPVKVNHTVTTHGFIVDDGNCSIGFTGDTYITDTFWEQCNNKDNLKAVIVDVSFPGHMHEEAEITKHMSTDIILDELNKLVSKDVEILISHMKPKLTDVIQSELNKAKTVNSLTFLEDGMTLEY